MNKNYLNLKFGLVDIIANLHLSHATKIFYHILPCPTAIYPLIIENTQS